MIGVWVLLGAVVVTALVAAVTKAVNGRFRAVVPVSASASPPAVSTGQPSAPAAADGVSVDDLGGAALGRRATFLQFSSSFCAPCRATRLLLADVVAAREGVVHVEVDAEANLELVRRLNVLRTPTVLVLDADGVVRGRASGAPRRDQVEAALDALAAP